MNRGRVATALALALLLPYAARLPGVALFGADWFLSYVPGVAAVLFMAAVNLVPAAALLALAGSGGRLPFALAAGFMGAAQLALHGSLDLASDSTAAVALVVFPVLAAIAAVLGWGLGWLVARLRN